MILGVLVNRVDDTGDQDEGRQEGSDVFGPLFGDQRVEVGVGREGLADILLCGEQIGSGLIGCGWEVCLLLAKAIFCL